MKIRKVLWLLWLTILTAAANDSCSSPPVQTSAGKKRAKKKAKKKQRASFRGDGGNHPPSVPRGARISHHQQTVFKCPVCHVQSEGGKRHNKHAHAKAGKPI